MTSSVGVHPNTPSPNGDRRIDLTDGQSDGDDGTSSLSSSSFRSSVGSDEESGSGSGSNSSSSSSGFSYGTTSSGSSSSHRRLRGAALPHPSARAPFLAGLLRRRRPLDTPTPAPLPGSPLRRRGRSPTPRSHPPAHLMRPSWRSWSSSSPNGRDDGRRSPQTPICGAETVLLLLARPSKYILVISAAALVAVQYYARSITSGPGNIVGFVPKAATEDRKESSAAAHGTRGRPPKYKPRPPKYEPPDGTLLDSAKRIQAVRSNGKERESDKSEKCAPLPWQVTSYPSCNDVHSVDLGTRLWDDLLDRRHEIAAWTAWDRKRHRRRIGPGPVSDGDGEVGPEPFVSRGSVHLGSGHWRDVFRVPGAALKIVKSQHDVTERNFDRHRRDALVMERLTAVKSVVDVYGFCGNSVLSQYVGDDLAEYIYPEDTKKKITMDGVPVPRAAPQRDDPGKWKMLPLRERMELARDVLTGIAALHRLDPKGPVVHADMQARQFLVLEEDDSDTGNEAPGAGESGTREKKKKRRTRALLNDFNRCRFMEYDAVRNDSCTFKIPSAPGISRSPEEYAGIHLDEKLDIYSAGNVLYGILTGRRHWDDIKSSKVVKDMIRGGGTPEINYAYRRDAKSPEGQLAAVIKAAYTTDPVKRPGAAELLERVERILDQMDREEGESHEKGEAGGGISTDRSGDTHGNSTNDSWVASDPNES